MTMLKERRDVQKEVVGFYGISTLLGYLMLNPIYIYIY